MNQIEFAEIEWVIKDSGRCKETIEWARTLNNPGVLFVSSLDTGIYDALNQALIISNGEYYVTLGSDDTIFVDGITNFLTEYNRFSNYDVIVYPVFVNCRLNLGRSLCPLFVSTSGYISSHSVGTLIRRSVHERLGMYDVNYKILADSLFITRCIQNKLAFFYATEIAFGIFSTQGISSTNHRARLVEAYRYQRSSGSSAFTQAILFLFRMIRYFPSIIFHE